MAPKISLDATSVISWEGLATGLIVVAQTAAGSLPRPSRPPIPHRVSVMTRLETATLKDDSARSQIALEPTASAAPIAGIASQFSTSDASLKSLELHLDFLKQISTVPHPSVSLATATAARIAWFAIWRASNYAIPLPAACTGPDGKLAYAWDRDEHHLELEFIPNQPAEFFYRNRATRELWGEDYIVGSRLSEEAIDKLKFFA